MAWQLKLRLLLSQAEFDWDIGGSPFFRRGPFHPIPERARQHLPKFATQTKVRKNGKLTDVVSLCLLRAVSVRFKSLIERFQPGVHEFIPIELRDHKGKPHDAEYYIFICHDLRDVVMPSRCLDRDWNVKEWPVFPHFESMRFGTSDQPIVASAPALKGASFFVQFLVREIGDHVCVSEAAYAALKTEKITGFDMKEPWVAHWDEVDAPWDADREAGPMIKVIEEHLESEVIQDLIAMNRPCVKRNKPHWLKT
ncbi:MAG: hypothetical protein HOO99_00635 [Hyphomicrobiaceae bacterium]|nr:hypothetical protein [Hyphomicrobiaceae bacterium]